MSGAGGVQSVVLPPISQSAFIETIKPGQVLIAMIKGTQTAPSVQVAGIRIPIGPETGLTPGQTVTVEVLRNEAGIQLRIVPQTPSAAQASVQTAMPAPAQSATTAAVATFLSGTEATPSVAADLAPVLVSVLESLGVREEVGSAQQLIPAALPAKAALLRQLIGMLTTPASTGQDLQLIQSYIGQAASAGVVPQTVADGFATLLAQLFGVSSGSETRQLMHQLTNNPSRGTEARIALALATGNLESLSEELRADVKTQLAQLRRDDSLIRFLQSSGGLRTFEQAAERVFERLTGGQIQNLRSLEMPYQFLEVPFLPGSPFDRVQVHFFGEGRGGRRGFSSKDATVVLDVSMTRLGDIWIAMSIAQGRCTCRFRAVDPEAVDALQAETEELVQALTLAGYPSAQIHVEHWHGDRFAEMAGLMRRFSGISLDG